MSEKKDMPVRVFRREVIVNSDEGEQVYEEYLLAPDFPKNEKKRGVCFDHISQGFTTELMDEFIQFGVRFPEPTELQEITTKLSCKGVECILKKCGFKIEQHDSTGEKIGEMHTWRNEN